MPFTRWSESRRVSRRWARLIDELLKLSRLDRQPLAHTTVDLSALAHEIVAELRTADPE